MDGYVRLAVNGTLMQGLGLHQNMINAGATFEKEAKTAKEYRLYSINDEHPAMMRVYEPIGAEIALETYLVPAAGLVSILQNEPPGLCIGKINLNSQEQVLGVLGEAILCEGQQDITEYGGWRAYTAAKASGKPLKPKKKKAVPVASSSSDEKSKKKRAKRDPNAPKKAKTSFLYFAEVQRPLLKHEHPSMSFADIGKEIGARWQKLSPSEKQSYVDKSEQDKLRYDRERNLFQK